MSTFDAGDYTVTTTATANGQVATYTAKPGTTADNADQLLSKAAAALAANKTFLAISSPTNAQSISQVKALTRQVNAIIRLLVVDDLTDISDT